MITALWYEVFLYLCIFLVIGAGIAIVAWKWKAVIVIALAAACGLCVYWLPIGYAQWKFAGLHEENRWVIVYSSDLSPNPLAELRFLRTDRIILADKNRSLRSPTVTRDGRRIAFAIVDASVPGEGGIGVMNLDGSGFRRASPPLATAEGLSWSPDGRTIAFWSGRNAETQTMDLCLLDAESGRTRVLLGKATFYGTPFPISWAPEGRRLVFTSTDGYVSIIDVSSGALTAVTKGDAPSWSPDGSTIIYREGVPHSRKPEERIRYYRISPDGRGRGFVFDGGSGGTAEGQVTDPVVWSPDGRYILFFRSYEPLFDTNFSKVSIIDLVARKTYVAAKKKHIQGCSWAALEAPSVKSR